MPQMSPLSWTFIIILTIGLLLSTSSFLYFMLLPTPSYIYSPPSSFINPPIFIWTW